MIVRSSFSPGQRVHIIDANQEGRVIGVMITAHGIAYLCRWWDGNTFQENDFDDHDLEAIDVGKGVVMYCPDGESDIESTTTQ